MPNDSISEEFDRGKPRNRIVLYLAEHGESSPYQISKDLYKRVTDGYSTVTQNLRDLEEEGYVEFVRLVPSVKGGQQKLYCLTPFLGLMLGLACSNDTSRFLDREPSDKEGYRKIWDGFAVTLDVLGPNQFMKLVRESLIALKDEIARKGRRLPREKREQRLLSLFVWPLLSEEASEKEIIKLCKDSQLMAGYLQDSYRRALRILRASGRLPRKTTVH
ncbi:MAG: PadR family transcriptional regulator [Thaumarchaeota archaeon]|nr:PadR family transcriptional regulator [Nitrososphaerota archaeon]